MASPFVAEILMFGGNFAPVGYAKCDGQLMSIAQNTALFSILGTTYGGDGQNTFALPDLRGRLPLHQGPGYVLGQVGGAPAVTLTVGQIPAHTHTFGAGANTGAANTPNPVHNSPATPASGTPYADTGGAIMAAGSANLSIAGGGQPHNNQMPSLAVNFIIALFGIYPSRN